MTTFRCRTTLPVESDWVAVEAETPEQAANDFHEEHTWRLKNLTWVEATETGRYEIHFVRVEVEGHGTWVSRVYQYRIWRKGGVRTWEKPRAKRLQALAEALGWDRDPEELLTPGWEGEETMEDAQERQFSSQHKSALV